MTRALLWKEWREQGWRGALSVLVMVLIAGGMARAQIIPLPATILAVFFPLGLLLAIFLAMGAVATEREDRTWLFLIARPISPAHILRVKWLFGATMLAAALLLAGAAVHWAGFSRGQFIPAVASIGEGRSINTAGWLWTVVCGATVSMVGWYTVLVCLLTRARNELHAGLGGILLTLACLAWSLQYWAMYMWKDRLGPAVEALLWIPIMLNPLSGLLLSGDPGGCR